MINKCLIYLDNHKEKINKSLPVFLISYISLLILPYIFGRVEVINAFFSEGWSKALFRLLTMGYAVIYLALVGLANKMKIKWYYLVGGGILLTLLLISSIFAPKDIYKLDGTLGTHISPWEYIYSFIHFFISILLFIFIITFVAPIMPSLKVLNIPLLILIGITSLSIIISLFIEGKDLIELINGGDAHAKDISGIFQNKNTYGLFIFLSSISCAFLMQINSDNNKYLYLFICLIVFMFFSTIIGCRTAFVCSLALIFYLFIRAMIILRNYSKKIFNISLIIIGGVVLLFILYMSIPLFHQKPLDLVYKLVIYSFAKLGDSFSERMSIWGQTGNVMDPFFYVFGANFDNSKYLLVRYTHNFRDYHSCYVSWFVQTGVIGTLIYALLFGYITYQIYRLIRKDLEEGLLVLIIFLVSILYGIPETHTMFISTSLFTFVTNLLIVVYLQYSLKEKEQKQLQLSLHN